MGALGRKANILSAHTGRAVLVFSWPFFHFYGVKHLFRLVGARAMCCA